MVTLKFSLGLVSDMLGKFGEYAFLDTSMFRADGKAGDVTSNSDVINMVALYADIALKYFECRASEGVIARRVFAKHLLETMSFSQ